MAYYDTFRFQLLWSCSSDFSWYNAVCIFVHRTISTDVLAFGAGISRLMMLFFHNWNYLPECVIVRRRKWHFSEASCNAARARCWWIVTRVCVAYYYYGHYYPHGYYFIIIIINIFLYCGYIYIYSFVSRLILFMYYISFPTVSWLTPRGPKGGKGNSRIGALFVFIRHAVGAALSVVRQRWEWWLYTPLTTFHTSAGN